VNADPVAAVVDAVTEIIRVCGPGPGSQGGLSQDASPDSTAANRAGTEETELSGSFGFLPTDSLLQSYHGRISCAAMLLRGRL
jgi:hypothetical protein